MEYIKIVASPEGVEPDLDIVFVHGLNPTGDPEHARNTWTHREDKNFWPGTLLPEVLPKARVLLFAYNASVSSNASNIPVASHAQSLLDRVHFKRQQANERHRPLIFIGHSLGGIIIKQALVQAKSNDRKYGCLKSSTYGLFFFSTPHAGGNNILMAKAFSKVWATVTGEPSNSLLGSVEKRSLLNENLSNDFANQMSDYQIRNYHETRKTSLKFWNLKIFPQFTSMYAVDRQAANILGSDFLPIDRNHSEICKYSRTDDLVWEIIGPHLKSMGEMAVRKRIRCNHASMHSLDEILQHHSLPSSNLALRQPPTDPGASLDFQTPFTLEGMPVLGSYVRRDDEMQRMERSLVYSELQDERQIHVLCGLGGVGKTQLAIAYARKHQQKYSTIIWIDGRSRDTLLQSLASFADRAGIKSMSELHEKEIEDQANAVLRWLALSENNKWLVVFDNVDRDYSVEQQDPDAYDIRSFLPADHGSVLITTRLAHLQRLGSFTTVSTFDLQQSLELLAKSSGLPLTCPGAQDVVMKLGKLPLAIMQAGRYIQQTGGNYHSYLRLYETSRFQLMSEAPKVDEYPNGSIYTTWNISYEHLKRSNNSAAKLLQLWAYLDRILWFDLLNRGFKALSDQACFQSIAIDEITFGRVMKSLLDYSLVECRRDTESYSLHPVVHDWCGEYVSKGDINLMMGALKVVGFAIPSTSEVQYWNLQQRLIPHANQCLNQFRIVDFPEAFKDPDYLKALKLLSDLYSDQGKKVQAATVLTHLLRGEENMYGFSHALTLDTVDRLGRLYISQHDKLPEAEEMFDRALSGYENLFQPKDTTILNAVNNLGTLYVQQQRPIEAEKMFKRALSGFEKKSGLEHTAIFIIFNNLGALHASQNRPTEAIDMYQQALRGREDLYGHNDILTLTVVGNVATLYKDQGELSEAEEMYLQAQVGYENARGPNNETVLTITRNLASVYVKQGRHDLAWESYKKALDGYEMIKEPDDPLITETQYQLLVSAVAGTWAALSCGQGLLQFVLDWAFDAAWVTAYHLAVFAFLSAIVFAVYLSISWIYMDVLVPVIGFTQGPSSALTNIVWTLGTLFVGLVVYWIITISISPNDSADHASSNIVKLFLALRDTVPAFVLALLLTGAMTPSAFWARPHVTFFDLCLAVCLAVWSVVLFLTLFIILKEFFNAMMTSKKPHLALTFADGHEEPLIIRSARDSNNVAL